MNWTQNANQSYLKLADYAAQRSKELTPLLQPYIDTTDQYGKLVCEVVLVLGKTPPPTKRDAVTRDLMADVFDFLYEARALITKGKLEIAYPLARRAYESLSLMVACHLEPTLADRWIAGKEIKNSEIRRALGKHPAGETEEKTRALYQFFSQTSHPNRDTIAHRFLGDGNEFVLGSVGKPSLALLADYALNTLNLWFWFGAFVSFIYRPALARATPEFKDNYDIATRMAHETARWLAEQFDRVLAEEQAEMRR